MSFVFRKMGLRQPCRKARIFSQELSWGSVRWAYCTSGRGRQIAYTEDAETLEQQENMYRLLPGFRHYGEEYSEILKKEELWQEGRTSVQIR